MVQPHSSVSMPNLRTEQLLTWWQRSLIGMLLLTIVAYGLSLAMESTPSLVLQSSLQAGWNVLHDKGMYDEQPRVYRGPPLMAIAAAPFGHSSSGNGASDSVPYPVTRALWFFVNVLCFWLATHWLVSLLETIKNHVAPLRWWLHRLLPLLLLIVPLADSLQEGFADGVLLLVITALVISLTRWQFFAAGLALAFAMCLQLTAMALLFIPIWRRDRVMSIGVMCGLLFCLVLLPGLMFGLQHTNQLNEQYVNIIKQYGQEALGEEQNHSLASLVKQVLTTTSADRDQWALAIALSCLGLLTLFSCGLMGFREELDPLRLFHFIGSLLIITLLAHPLSALHSYSLLVPSVIGILRVVWNPATSHRVKMNLTVSLATMLALISLPLHQPVLPLFGVIVCWLVNAVLLYRSSSSRQITSTAPSRHLLVTLPETA
ncbi:MAG TPA: glycosyltransferase 87 family protein [Gemmatales bacterium]|nr:glycosyltransferase 87 family protein [Gemmatales bacterium]